MRRLIALLFSCLSLSVHATTLADQVAAMTPGTWALISTESTAAAVDPSRDPATNERCRAAGRSAPCTGVVPYYSGSASTDGAMYGAWNGGAFASGIGTCGTLLFAGGGHTDWYGNEVTGLDMCGGTDGAPVWRLMAAPFDPSSSASNMMDVTGSFPAAPAGKQRSPSHGYGGIASLGDGLFASTSDSCRSENATGCTTPHEYAPDAWLWKPVGGWAGPFLHDGAQAGCAIADTKRKVYWFQPDIAGGRPGQFSQFNPGTGAVLMYGVPNKGGSEHMCGYDPDRDMLVLMACTTSACNVSEKDPNNPAGPWTVVTQINKPTLTNEFAGGSTLSWSARRHAFIVFAGNANNPRVYELKSTSVLQDTWTLLTDPSIVAPIAVSQNGLFGKFQVVPTDTAEVLIGTTGLTGGVWAFRIPGTELARLPCSSPGVFVCESFAGSTSGKLIASMSGSGVRPEVKNGALQFTIPALSGADAGGHFETTFPAVGEGGTIAWSYRVKTDAAAAALPGRKEFTVWRGSLPCTDLELTLTHDPSHLPLNVLYTACGARGFSLPLAGSDKLYHFPDFDCHYLAVRTGDLSKCAVTTPDVWLDYYFELTIGHFGQADSRLVAWQHIPGQPWRRFVERNDAQINGDGGLDHFMLTVYMTGKDATVANPAGTVQYDNLVLSTKPFFADLKG